MVRRSASSEVSRSAASAARVARAWSTIAVGVAAIRLAAKCTLCRPRHNIHYADLRTMPTLEVNPLVVGVNELARSA